MKQQVWWKELVLLLFVYCASSVGEEYQPDYSEEHLTPYSSTRHGSRRDSRDIIQCQHVKWENRTYEELANVSIDVPSDSSARYELHRFADAVMDGYTGIKRRYVVGSIAFLEQPYYTLSVLEPGSPGGCNVQYWSATRSLVSETSSHRVGGCRLAINAGYFNVHNGKCLGNIVSDGRVVQTSDDEQNANFGIRQDGTITVGYIPDQEILNSTNPFRQLVTGVVWLVRNGSNFVNESKDLECSSHEDTGRMDTFINVISARTAIGHDAQGRVVIAQVNGQTHHRGANLYEFAELLIRRGVVNAINLDGGGSSTFIKDDVLINYPSDHCLGMPEYRCERAVSTVLCVHDVQCIEPECSQHGSCDMGKCECDSPWTGDGCAQLNCSLIECFNNGTCIGGKCSCSAGWRGPFCNQTCMSGSYGPDCGLTCYCYGRSVCNPVTGACDCPDGYHGYGCWQECSPGYYGRNCQLQCACSEHGTCLTTNGSCLCHDGWEGPTCNDSQVSSGSEPTSQVLNESNSTHVLDSAPVLEDLLDTIRTSSDAATSTEGSVDHLTTNQLAVGDMTSSSTVTESNDLDTQTTPTIISCQTENQFHNIRIAVLLVIVTGLMSVCAHLVICWICHRRTYYNSRLKRIPQARVKRRKLRKKPLSMRVPLQSSSDCSI